MLCVCCVRYDLGGLGINNIGTAAAVAVVMGTEEPSAGSSLYFRCQAHMLIRDARHKVASNLKFSVNKSCLKMHSNDASPRSFKNSFLF